MSNIKNFRDKNHTCKVKENRSNYNPEFNKTVNMAGEKEKHGIKNNIDKYVEFLSWAR